MNDQITVLTPEKVVVAFPLAGIASRIMAHLVDLFIIFAIIAGVGYLVTQVTQAVSGSTFVILLGTVVLYGYFILFEYFWQGQTIGKRMNGIRTVMADGTPLTFIAAFYRNLVRIGDFLPSFYVVGMVSIFTNSQAQRLGDLVAGTLVVRTVRPVRSFTPAPHRYGIHPFENSIQDLNQMSIEEYFAIKRLCDRFPELPKATQDESLATVWRPFADKHGIHPIPNVHPVYQMEAVIMRYGREHKLV